MDAAETYLAATVRERKGTMYLRSDHNEYDLTKTHVSNWNQDAESYPKDYDVYKDKPWNLKKSTYNHLSNQDGPMPKTTTQALYDDRSQAKFHVDREANKPLQGGITSDSRLDGNLVREVIGRNLIDRRAFYGLTTYKDDYNLYNGAKWVPHDITSEEKAESQKLTDDEKVAVVGNRNDLSQFTEKSRRFGANTWQDETGVYGTAMHKRLMTTQFNPLMNAFEA